MPESFEDKIDYAIKPKTKKPIVPSHPQPQRMKQTAIYMVFMFSIFVILAIAIIQTRQVSILNQQNEVLKATITSLQATVESLQRATPIP